MPATQKACSWTEEEQRALIARLLRQPQFARSARLRDFLQYVAEQSISHPNTPIGEMEIAERIFGRSAIQGADDSIVRVHASQLRKRLELYFETDGAAEELVLGIPKGNYAPVFKRRVVEREAAELSTLAPVGGAAKPRLRWMMVALALLCLATALLVWDDVQVRARAALPLGSFQKLFWSELVDSATTCDVVLADSGFAYLRELSRVDLSMDQYANHDFGKMTDALTTQGGLRDWAAMLIHRRFTSVGDFNMARKFFALAGNHPDRMPLVLARDFSPGRLKADNVILIGAKRSNPWAELFEGQLNFQYAFEESETLIRNLKPKAGEQEVYHAMQSSTQRIPGGYCVVARLTNGDSKSKVILIAGTESESTEAGGEFLVNENSLSQLYRALHAEQGDAFPDFEALLGTTKVGGSSPVSHLISLRRH